MSGGTVDARQAGSRGAKVQVWSAAGGKVGGERKELEGRVGRCRLARAEEETGRGKGLILDVGMRAQMGCCGGGESPIAVYRGSRGWQGEEGGWVKGRHVCA